jgi:thymidylate synthase (FAD)
VSEITLTSEITVRLIQQCGGDHMTVASAKVSTSGEEALKYAGPVDGGAKTGLINYLVKNRHGTPAEHGLMTFFVHAPAFVWWEWIRHRVGMTVDCPELSFNLESGRYKVLDPVFWIPGPDRKMVPAADHKPARPKFVPASDGAYLGVKEDMQVAYGAAWTAYCSMIANGIANEVARSVLGFGVYYSGWVSCNPRSLMSFLSLRTHDPEAKFPSFPLAEIEEAARAAERIFATYWPVTHAAFVANGRVAP